MDRIAAKGGQPNVILGMLFGRSSKHTFYVLNAMARGQSPARRVAVWAAGHFQASSSASAHNAMEAVDVAATFAAVQQKLIRTLPGNLSSTPPDSFE